MHGWTCKNLKTPFDNWLCLAGHTTVKEAGTLSRETHLFFMAAPKPTSQRATSRQRAEQLWTWSRPNLNKARRAAVRASWLCHLGPEHPRLCNFLKNFGRLVLCFIEDDFRRWVSVHIFQEFLRFIKCCTLLSEKLNLRNKSNQHYIIFQKHNYNV